MRITLLPGTICARCVRRLRLPGLRWSSTEANHDAPLLGTMRGDLKAAMRSKDKSRLKVLRAIIAEANNASKTSSPIRENMQVLSMIKKMRTASKNAAVEFAEAKREDLQKQQEEEISVLDGYASQVKVMSKEEVLPLVENTIESMKASGAALNPGSIMKELLKFGGPLDGMLVDKGQVAKMVQEGLKAL